MIEFRNILKYILMILLIIFIIGVGLYLKIRIAYSDLPWFLKLYFIFGI